MIALRLAKAGYCGGDPEKIIKKSADWVLKMLEYELFLNEYEAKYIDLNKRE